MFCRNCGKEVDEKAVVCVGCGVPLDNKQYSEKKGKGIASMVLGIIGTLYALLAFSAFSNLEDALYDVDNVVAFAFGFVLVQSIFATIAISLAASDRRKKKNGFNSAGLWLSIATFIMVTIQFIYVIAY